MGIEATEQELLHRDRVLANLREFTVQGKVIPLDRSSSEFSGNYGDFRYIFEGEDDLLHLILERRDGAALKLEETGAIVRFLLPDVPEAMIWMRPGELAHHFYLGHDLLLES